VVVRNWCAEDVDDAESLAHLAQIVRNTCQIPGAKPDTPTFEVVTTAEPKQQCALDLIKAIKL